MSAMMANGSSVRGLSEVMTTRSAAFSASPPMSGRLVLSRSPPQPKTAMSLPRVISRAVSKTLATEAGVWA